MKKFINLSGTNHVTRQKAKGYKELVIEAEDMDSVEIVTTENDSLCVRSCEDVETDNTYLILCNEFGLLGLDKDFKSKLNVMFLDDGLMLIELVSGTVICEKDNDLVMYSLEETVPQIVEYTNGLTNILWVDSKYLLSYLTNEKCSDWKYRFIYDIQFSLTLGGVVELKDSYTGGTEQFEIELNNDEDLDISLGYIARSMEQEEKNEEYIKDSGNEE